MKYFQILCFFIITLNVNVQTVYKTPSGKKYHVESCRMVSNVSQKLTLNDAIKIGLTACKICNPPTSKQNFAPESNKAKGEANTVQCKAKTKAETRCKHKTSIANGYCFQHNPDK